MLFFTASFLMFISSAVPLIIVDPTPCFANTASDCAEIKQARKTASSGVYQIRLGDASSCNRVRGHAQNGQCCVEVYCDMETFGGGWTVFQNRFDGSVDFFKTWSAYETGFGNLNGEFWAGNKFLHHFTSRKEYDLAIELYQEEKQCSLYALFSKFSIDSGNDNYRLHIGPYKSGTAGAHMSYHNNMPFSTKDRDNDPNTHSHCAQKYRGAWWYKTCHATNLNGEYYSGCTKSYATTMTYASARGQFYSFAKTQMKLRPSSYTNLKNAVDSKFCTDENFTPCPVDCHWKQWGLWGPCDTSGKQVRTRGSIPRKQGGAGCKGSASATKSCKCSANTASDCAEIKQRNTKTYSGVYQIRLGDAASCAGIKNRIGKNAVCCVEVYCDMDTFGGGWTVFQNRFDGSVDFFKTWSAYETGFGNLNGEFWAGNKFLHHFTSRKAYDLAIELYQEEKQCSLYALFSKFSIDSGNENYRLHIGPYKSGTAGAHMSYHNNMPFSTKDRDNDPNTYSHCAQKYRGAWWYKTCHATNLNGEYYSGCTKSYATTMTYASARGQYYSFAKTQMKLRPSSYTTLRSAVDSKFCTDENFTPCPLDCHWKQWGPWGPCKTSGKQVRTRASIPRKQGGANCKGSASNTKTCTCTANTASDCAEIKQRNNKAYSGVYKIRLGDAASCAGIRNGITKNAACCVEVYCDMETFGGGWTVFQNRFDGSVNFFQTWSAYETGFGNLNGEFWAGNKFLHHFTSRKAYDLAIELYQEEKKCSLYALFSKFSIDSSKHNYRLHVGDYKSGTAGGGSFSYHNNMSFSTKDRDNDGWSNVHCAQLLRGAWWYKGCHQSNLNGDYYSGCTNTYATKITYLGARGQYYSFGRTQMKLRPSSYITVKNAADTKFCTDENFTPCPYDCNWKQWGPWSSCGTSGKQVRTRGYKIRKTQGGRNCIGSASDTKSCTCSANTASDCAEIKQRNTKAFSGVYHIRLGNAASCTGIKNGIVKNAVCCMEVYCDMETFGGGWTVIQNRFDASVNFYRGWSEYETGFGNVNGQFWMGNKFLHQFTSRKSYDLEVELYQRDQQCSLYALYTAFSVDSAKNKYTLHIGKYMGGLAGDSMSIHNNMPFSTKNRDHDKAPHGNCAKEYTGAWWYTKCHQANLNGAYFDGCVPTKPEHYAKYMMWFSARGYYFSFGRTQMKLRPASYSLKSKTPNTKLCHNNEFIGCPGDCNWNAWGPWSHCETSAGKKVRKRTQIPKTLAGAANCTGSSIETKSCACSINVCRNGGSCLDQASHTCRCKPGYVGKNCQSKAAPCSLAGVTSGPVEKLPADKTMLPSGGRLQVLPSVRGCCGKSWLVRTTKGGCFVIDNGDKSGDEDIRACGTSNFTCSNGVLSGVIPMHEGGRIDVTNVKDIQCGFYGGKNQCP